MKSLLEIDCFQIDSSYIFHLSRKYLPVVYAGK